jgi:hypothetical protein
VNDNNIPVAKAIFDTHSVVRKKIEAANFAVVEALVAMVDYQDPLAAAVFGANAETLKKLATMEKTKLNALLMTGLPIFLLRIASPEFKAALEGSGSEDALLRALLESYSEQLPITSL